MLQALKREARVSLMMVLYTRVGGVQLGAVKVKAFKFGQMAESMRATGKRIELMAKAGSYGQMAMSMKANGRMI